MDMTYPATMAITCGLVFAGPLLASDGLDEFETTPVSLVSAVHGTAQASLGALPVQNQATQFAATYHVPEFMGTVAAFGVMTWALRSRRVI